MQSHPKNAVEALSSLLQRWVDVAFPANKRSDDEAALLVLMWRDVAGMLCGPNSPEVATFVRESSHREANGRTGDPPVHELEQLLNAVVHAGLREYFLTVAVRQALDRMIQDRFPRAVAPWTMLADGILPLWVQFGLRPDEGPSETTSHTVGR